MKTIKLFTIALLIASAAILMTACKGSTPKDLEGTTWKAYYPGSTTDGMKVIFESKTQAKLIDFEYHKKYEEDVEICDYTYNDSKGEFTKNGLSIKFEVNGDELTVYLDGEEDRTMVLKKQ